MCYKLFTSTLIGAFFICTAQLHAQDASPHREIGLNLSGINFNGNNTFGAFYKKETKENVYRRLRFFYGNLNTDFLNDNYSLSFGGGVAFGREKRKSLDNKLVFYQGPECSASLALATSSGNGSFVTSVNARFGWVLGLQHSFNERWAINLETIPGVAVNVRAAKGADTALGFGATASNNISLGLVRKF